MATMMHNILNKGVSIAFGVIVLSLLATPAQATHGGKSQTEAAREADEIDHYFLEHTINILTIVQENAEQLSENPEPIYQALKDDFEEWVDLQAFVRGVLGSFYKETTPAQLDAFAARLQKTLVRTYAKTLVQFHPNSISLQPRQNNRKKKRGKQQKEKENKPLTRKQVLLNAKIKSGAVFPFTYSTRLGKDGKWRARNLIVRSVNLGLTFRNQFAAAMSDPVAGGSLDKVIENWE